MFILRVPRPEAPSGVQMFVPLFSRVTGSFAFDDSGSGTDLGPGVGNLLDFFRVFSYLLAAGGAVLLVASGWYFWRQKPAEVTS